MDGIGDGVGPGLTVLFPSPEPGVLVVIFAFCTRSATAIPTLSANSSSAIPK